ncbi:response regulator [Oxalicibacterium faecigallinarum]|uniref:Response regulatory domain-containing protein n=1 Tax=Oxalicibacterium faecigallinarum TaxID=573741 RepID=A0A8J3ARD3_9BURK|nr:response regulator [Oxalicibacterium faecigallinarum]GGI19062.1 hypothetical protein GCM10008066_17200 [Oxalicibacterium faecigallinarum]
MTNEKTLQVLLVEDNVDALEGMIEMTRFFGHEAHGCASAESALDLLTKESFDVMVTDIGLPGMSGLELARKAREIQELDITVASGYARGDDVPDDVGWLMKPFGIEEYAALLAKVVGH